MTTKRMLNFNQTQFLGDEDSEMHDFDSFSLKVRIPAPLGGGQSLADPENTVEVVVSVHDKFSSVLQPLKVSDFNV